MHFLDFTFEQYFEAIKYIIESIKCKKESYVKCMEIAIKKIKIKKNNEKSLKDLIQTNFEEIIKNKDILNAGFQNRLIEVRKNIIFTPARIEIQIPSKSMPNRTLKTFLKNIDDFLRVSFRNDNHEKLMYNSTINQSQNILDYF